MIDLVAGARGHPNTKGAKGGAKPTRARGLIVSDIKDEIVADNVVTAATQVDSKCGPGRPVVVSDATDLVSLNGCSRYTGAVHAHINAMGCAARRDVALDLNGGPRDHGVR